MISENKIREMARKIRPKELAVKLAVGDTKKIGLLEKTIRDALEEKIDPIRAIEVAEKITGKSFFEIVLTISKHVNEEKLFLSEWNE